MSAQAQAKSTPAKGEQKAAKIEIQHPNAGVKTVIVDSFIWRAIPGFNIFYIFGRYFRLNQLD